MCKIACLKLAWKLIINHRYKYISRKNNESAFYSSKQIAGYTSQSIRKHSLKIPYINLWKVTNLKVKFFLYYAQSGEFCKENLQLVTCKLEMFYYILTQEVYLFFLCYTEFYFRDLFWKKRNDKSCRSTLKFVFYSLSFTCRNMSLTPMVTSTCSALCSN